MPSSIAHLERRLETLESDVDRRFDKVTECIGALGDKLVIKIDGVQSSVRTEVNGLLADKFRAEGYRAGVTQTKTPNPWLLQLIPVVLAAALTLAATLAFQGSQPTSRSTVTSTATVERPMR